MTYLIILSFLITALAVTLIAYACEVVRTNKIVDCRNDIIHQLNDMVISFEHDLKGTFNKN